MNLIKRTPKSSYHLKLAGLCTFSFILLLYGSFFAINFLPDGHWAVWPTSISAFLLMLLSVLFAIGAIIKATEAYEEEKEEERRQERNSPNYRG